MLGNAPNADLGIHLAKLSSFIGFGKFEVFRRLHFVLRALALAFMFPAHIRATNQPVIGECNVNN